MSVSAVLDDEAGVSIGVIEASRRTIDLEIGGLQALRGALDCGLGEKIAQACAAIREAQRVQGRVIVTGMGKSGHVGRKIAATLSSTGTPAHFLHPAEASHGDLGMVGEQDVVIALSWSGEAPELADLIGYTRRFKVCLIAITSRADSALGAEADITLLLPRSPEACPNGLAPTTSTTMQMALGDALAVSLLSLRGFSASDFRQFHPGGKLGARLRKVSSLMHQGVEMPLVAETVALSTAIVEMTAKRFGVTGVVDAAGALIGVVTDGDLRRAFAGGLVDQPVGAVMTTDPFRLAPEALADEALAYMNDLKITSVFVVEAGAPVGILHIHDLLRAGVA
ncbi:SIS domain-containing protein [Xanthobacteraceae bacterium A53D]